MNNYFLSLFSSSYPKTLHYIHGSCSLSVGQHWSRVAEACVSECMRQAKEPGFISQGVGGTREASSWKR